MRYLGIDFGLKRVGLARSEGTLASPWKVITGQSFKDLINKLQQEAPFFDKLVVGLPEGKVGRLAKKVIKILQKRGFDVVEADETLSTKFATQLMVEMGISRKKRLRSDDIAAAIILQNYLDSHKE